jgi:hypothetical protein
MKRILIVALIVLAAAVGRSQTTPAVSLTWSDVSCTAATPCTAQVYRATVTAGASCPAAGGASYTELTAVDSQPAVAGAYTDSTVTAGSTYCWYVTDSFATGGTSPSSPSNIFQLAIPNVPATPTGLTGTVVAGS